MLDKNNDLSENFFERAISEEKSVSLEEYS